ncbi:hypothetical protein LR48_Vigan05g144100 [Vigna angularis]|uniref:Uncharacterized protein n=2 Tax=Phaseolus angularis TaxID=3914 RepID=A0A0L9UM96_PHAAN|nr:hypothetical protein LR48_Vigan05g144100 [Vigna angularis]BAT92408.1 hypothetical protein VIGAN_07111700 [Vigna angularis var. angularis]
MQVSNGRKKTSLLFGGRGAKETGLLELKVVELLLAVHLHDERDNEDEEGGAGDPGRLAGAPQELLRHKDGVTGGLLAPDDDGGARDLGEYGAGIAGPVRKRHSASLALGRHGKGKRRN